MIKIHKIKILSQYYNAVEKRIKTAEVRRNDREYETGDWLVLSEWTGTNYTGYYLIRRITAVYDLNKIGLNSYVLICME